MTSISIEIYDKLFQFSNKSQNINFNINKDSHVNTSSDMRNRMIKVTIEAFLIVVLPIGVVIGIGVFVFKT